MEPSARVKPAAGGGCVAGYGHITGEIFLCHEALGGGQGRWVLRGNFSELEHMAAEAWALGAKAWEEASAFFGILEDSILSGDGGAAMKCPSSLALGGGDRKGEMVEALERSEAGNGTVMVAQFAMELRGLRAADGEELPRILHLNPRLRGDWSRRPVLEMNTCFRMQRGKAQRSVGTPSSDGNHGIHS